MGYGVTLMKLGGDDVTDIPRNAIIALLQRHGYGIPELGDGKTELSQPIDEEVASWGHSAGPDTELASRPPSTKYAFSAEFVILSIKDGHVTEFGMHRPQSTSRCRALLFDLVQNLGLVMFWDWGGICGRKDILQNLPAFLQPQFPPDEWTIIRTPEDCI